jgi:hypothetical protein
MDSTLEDAMKDKFAEYYNSPEKIKELSEYVHVNFKLIHTKMISEMRRKLDITPDMQNSDGYVSLMVSLYGRMFNELVYSLAGISQSTRTKASDIIPKLTLKVLLDLYEGKNPLNGRIRTDVKEDLDGFKKYYLENIEDLRAVKEALPD